MKVGEGCNKPSRTLASKHPDYGDSALIAPSLPQALLKQLPDRLGAGWLWLGLAFHPGCNLRCQRSGYPNADCRVTAGTGASPGPFFLIGY